MTYLDRLATEDTFTPRTGDYQRARPWQVPWAAWVMARAFADRHDPAGHLLGCVWALLRWPVSFLEAVVFRLRGELLVPRGRLLPAAVRPINAPGSVSTNPRLWRFLLTCSAILMVSAPILFAYTLRAGIFPVPVVGLLLWLWLSFAVRLVLGGIRPAWQHRNDPNRGPKPTYPGPVVELTGLSAWPSGNSTGFPLFDQVLTDLDQQLPVGVRLILDPATPGLAELYADPLRGFRRLPGTHWMGRDSDPKRRPAWPRPVN